jgi:potassium uptake Trk family protein
VVVRKRNVFFLATPADLLRAAYSSQTMISNLGFTLTPDSMISFADATWPMLVLSFLAYAGNTCYPVLLRLLIVAMRRIFPKRSSIQEPLTYLLDHPRRCYTLLFPRGTTWALFGIVFAMNFIDVLLIIVLDLDNPAVNYLSPGPRVLAAIFQAASARHTGTASFNLAAVNPAVQFSLLVMMYIAVFPLAMSTRSSNVYEDRPVGIMKADAEVYDGQAPSKYLMNHLRNQLSFDLWYIFLGIFCLCVSESARIADNADPSFSVFAIFFEVVSAYGNVGLSLGYSGKNYSLSGEFKIFSKLVICAMMIRGRHRGLPHNLDHAIVLPQQPVREEDDLDEKKTAAEKVGYRMKKYNTT